MHCNIYMFQTLITYKLSSVLCFSRFCHFTHTVAQYLVYTHVSDIDECQMQPCQNAVCQNTLGSFRCDCVEPGFTLDSSQLACIGTTFG